MFKVQGSGDSSRDLLIDCELSVFDLMQRVNISVSNDGFFFRVTGPIFRGRHNYNVTFESDYSSSLEEAVFTLKSSLPDQYKKK